MPKLITAVFAIGFSLALVLLGYHAVAWVRGAYSNLEADTAAVLVVASTALLLCALIIASTLRSLGQDRITAQRWSAKAETYGLCLELLQNPDREIEVESRQLAERRLVLHAGQNVLQHYRALRNTESEPGRNTSVPGVDSLSQAMRRDLGEATFGLAKGDLASLLLRPRKRGAEPESPD
jgi:hypothetical protein